MPTSVVLVAWVAAIAAVGLAALADAVVRARRLRRQRALSDLSVLSWQQFEEVIADAFRRHGYRVREVGGRAMFVVMGGYTADAMQFAAKVGLTLVDGEELLRIIGTGLRGEALELPVPTAVSVPACPACGAAMVRRTACQGPRAGHGLLGVLDLSCMPRDGTDPRRGADRALTARFIPNEPGVVPSIPGRCRSRPQRQAVSSG